MRRAYFSAAASAKPEHHKPPFTLISITSDLDEALNILMLAWLWSATRHSRHKPAPRSNQLYVLPEGAVCAGESERTDRHAARIVV